ncbi:NAD(P)-dependent oxidoreductase [Paenibacillus sp. UASWS1643]|uniref:NAD(P)-dependent oxidoreductase n=1 Tax=Paenibacillus sp. UASWS1643 TaxID=2580422 RepID=UPI00123B4EAF|nr:NAD(P)H-binding protein [Paenibacillus sp. UASWS1643]KAA8752590.1 NAD(P)H-binding protein [Paenibacillus sp. UASWS1643]
MKVAIFGATGAIGKMILWELMDRGHEVTAVVRDPSKIEMVHERLRVEQGDLLNPDQVADFAASQEVVVSAYGPKFGGEEEMLEVTRSLIEGVRRAKAGRLVVVGGAGSLLTDSGDRLMDTPGFPEEVKPLAKAHADAYELIEASGIHWTYMSPAATITTGRRTGQFRVGMNRVITDDIGESSISVGDFAAALVDELDDPQFIQARFTVGY